MKGKVFQVHKHPFGPYKEHEGDSVDLGKKFSSTVPHKFSRKIREIFKILAWIGHFGGRNGNSHFFGPTYFSHGICFANPFPSIIHAPKGKPTLTLLQSCAALTAAPCATTTSALI